MIKNHRIGALSILLFIVGMIVAYLFAVIMSYAVAGGLALAAPNLILNAPGGFTIIYALTLTIFITILTTSLLYKSIKENRHRLLEFSAGIIIAMGGLLLGYFLYWVNKKLFDKKTADVYSYIIAFSIVFLIFLIIISIITYVGIYNVWGTTITPT